MKGGQFNDWSIHCRFCRRLGIEALKLYKLFDLK